jgi:glycosyltransferase involved in cell wall biosynthesis
VVFPPARHPILWYWWFEHSLPHILRKIKPDIFVSTDGYLSLSTDVKTLLVFHDIYYEHYPETLKWSVKKFLLHFSPKFAHRANRIVCVSEFSKKDICQTYGIDPAKIDVAHNGANKVYKPLNEDEKTQARKEFANDCPYFIYIGALLPRKNVARLLAAFDAFKQSIKTDVKLLIIGAKMFNTQDIEKAWSHMKFKNDVIFTGRLSPGKIEKVLGGAIALTYVSYYEGFGIPLVEAMYADVPVISSNVTSMPEVTGEAALLVDPFSIDSIKDALIRVYSDEALRNSLIEKGRIQRQLFNWDKTAIQLWKSIEKCIEEK